MEEYEALESRKSGTKTLAGPHPLFMEFIITFNSGMYFEAHEVLEPLWLSRRGQPEAPFYKGLIQLAGAFVHVSKGRIPPAVALLKLARENLTPFVPVRDGLDVNSVLSQISQWLGFLESPVFSVPLAVEDWDVSLETLLKTETPKLKTAFRE